MTNFPSKIGGLPGSAQNWWAQPTEESYVKDELENRVHDDACSGRMSLADAQALFRGRWTDGIERR
jgi:hypothetical protein